MVKLSAAFFHDESSTTIGGLRKCSSACQTITWCLSVSASRSESRGLLCSLSSASWETNTKNTLEVAGLFFFLCFWFCRYLATITSQLIPLGIATYFLTKSIQCLLCQTKYLTNKACISAYYLLLILGRINKKLLSCVSRFWLLRGWRDLGESVKKENLWQKSFLRIRWNEFLKICEQWYWLISKS